MLNFITNTYSIKFTVLLTQTSFAMSRMRARGQHSIISVSVAVLRLILLYFSRVVYDYQIENSMIVAIFYDKIMRSV